VILCGFATIVGVLTTRRIQSDFHNQVKVAADRLARSLDLQLQIDGRLACRTRYCPIRNLSDYAATQQAAVRIVFLAGDAYSRSEGAPFLGPPRDEPREYKGWWVEARPLNVANLAAGELWVQFARRTATTAPTIARVRFFLLLGVLGGAALALLAGLATARRAMSPIAQLTEAARGIARTRDPNVRLPRPAADDEVAELASTLEMMLRSLDDARAETEAALGRQREFVADASHELRTPLTAVLANLELLEEELAGEQREAAQAALRSTRRMRRLVADLLLLARADAGRVAPRAPVDLSAVVVDAVAELEPVAAGHELSVEAVPGALVEGVRDELHRAALNLIDNAIKHTEPGTAIRAMVRRQDDHVVLVVEDEGPGVPEDLRDRVFERFVRGAADRGGSTGLGLSIVRAVVETHGGTVALEAPAAGPGARFVVRLPMAAQTVAEDDVDVQTTVGA
jgi:signal transduction histidine kinase